MHPASPREGKGIVPAGTVGTSVQIIYDVVIAHVGAAQVMTVRSESFYSFPRTNTVIN